ncbi:MAG TPA: FecR family protein [Niabella sp.]|nr:FecR family protein [Candidatus Woesebacteria bacterium]HRO83616.1 FecR family protein [Niabella sp.]
MNNQRFLELLVKKLSKSLTLPEHKELQEMADNDIYRQRLIVLITHILETEVNIAVPDKSLNILEHIENINKKISNSEQYHSKVVISEKKRNRTLTYTFIIAASLLFLVSTLSFYLFFYRKSSENSPNLVITKKASRTNITLPDGSNVWINSDTKLKYGNDFGNKSREIFLNGEAYFEVVKNTNLPFIVHTKLMDIRVLGTGFNVKAYEEDNVSYTSLIHGSIQVTLNNKSKDRIILEPNDKLTVRKETPPSVQKQEQKIKNKITYSVSLFQNGEDNLETAWVSDKLIFKNESLDEIIPVLERWYNIQIITSFQNKPITKVTGTFDNDSLDDVLRSLQLSAGFNYKIYKDSVLIY